MINKKDFNNHLSGVYEVTLKDSLTTKEWIYHWFIIKNFFKEFNFNLYDINDNYLGYLNILNSNKDHLKEFYGEFIYSEKNGNDYNINKKLINYFSKYTKINNIDLKAIDIKNSQIKRDNKIEESFALGVYNIELNTPIHPSEWTYHWFIIKNMFVKLNYKIEELNDNYPEYRYILGETDIFNSNTFKNPKIKKENYLDVFEGFCSFYNNKKINIDRENIKEYEAIRDNEISNLKSSLIKYFQSNNLPIKTINITKDKIYYDSI